MWVNRSWRNSNKTEQKNRKDTFIPFPSYAGGRCGFISTLLLEINKERHFVKARPIEFILACF